MKKEFTDESHTIPGFQIPVHNLKVPPLPLRSMPHRHSRLNQVVERVPQERFREVLPMESVSSTPMLTTDPPAVTNLNLPYLLHRIDRSWKGQYSM